MRTLNYRLLVVCWLMALFALACERKGSTEHNLAAARAENAIEGKILCGYQGWFNAEGDGSGLGWKHYEKEGKFEPGSCSIDFWPDLSEFDDDELYPTAFKHADGSPAYMFSSAHPKTVNRHFEWMQDYGIDGVFVQRFVSSTKNDKRRANMHKVFDNCFQSSVRHERLLSVMYDLSGSGREVVENTKRDWRHLVNKYGLNDPTKKNVLTKNGRSIVAIWGMGFKDRAYTLEDVADLIDFFKNDPVYGNCAVLLGVPTGWRTLDRDCISDPKIHDLIKKADIVHPWTPGRYDSAKAADDHREKYTEQDKLWCDQHGLTYMPVVFPGFSWHNLQKGDEKLNAIPRREGRFLWRQFYNAVRSDVETVYVAMFDEIDEGTSIFKCSNNPPVGSSPFASYEGLPSDYYLWLTGEAGRMLRGEVPLSDGVPEYPNTIAENKFLKDSKRLKTNAN
ncbi:MAG: glycoside hydrolase family 71/99-like protein [Cyclobacteriaceae bacterium]